MLGVNIAVGAHTAWPGVFPARLLVIDEFGTFASMAERMHRRGHGQGPPPALDQRWQIEWQGRQAGHRLMVAVHQPNLRWFGDTDSRGQYGYRLITGAFTSSPWRMTFGYTPPIQWDTRIKGRGAVGIGEAEELIAIGPGLRRHRGEPRVGDRVAAGKRREDRDLRRAVTLHDLRRIARAGRRIVHDETLRRPPGAGVRCFRSEELEGHIREGLFGIRIGDGG